MASTWICWYVDNYNDNVNVTFDGNTYNNSCLYLAGNSGNFALGVSPNGDKAIMANVSTSTSLPLNAIITHNGNPVTQASTLCDLIGGQPKPPNR